MSLIEIDKKLCSQCGLCAADCPMRIIELTPYPTVVEEKKARCLECQHCLAICPEGALAIFGLDPENSLPYSDQTTDINGLSKLIKLRRSVRRFKKKEVDKESIKLVVDAALHAPTARNDERVFHTIIDDLSVFKEFRKQSYAILRSKFDSNEVPPQFEFLKRILELWETDRQDILFRGAPHLLITAVHSEAAAPLHDAIIAISYFELLAHTEQIATLWNGYVSYLFCNIAPQEMARLVGIPDGYVVQYTLSFGYAAVNYARSKQIRSEHVAYVNQLQK